MKKLANALAVLVSLLLSSSSIALRNTNEVQCVNFFFAPSIRVEKSTEQYEELDNFLIGVIRHYCEFPNGNKGLIAKCGSYARCLQQRSK